MIRAAVAWMAAVAFASTLTVRAPKPPPLPPDAPPASAPSGDVCPAFYDPCEADA